MIEVDIYIDNGLTHFELDDTLKIIIMCSNINNEDAKDIKYATIKLNSHWDKNGYQFKIRYDDNKNLWECKRIVPFYDGCIAILCVYHSDCCKAVRKNEDVFHRLQQLYNPENISF